MLTQLYHDLLRVKLVNLNGNLSRTLDTWQIFGTHDHTRGPRRPSPCGPSDWKAAERGPSTRGPARYGPSAESGPAQHGSNLWTRTTLSGFRTVIFAVYM